LHEIREGGEKRIADCEGGRKGGENEADTAGLRCGLGIDTHFESVYDTCVLGLELVDSTVAAVLLRVIDVAERVVSEDWIQRCIRETERREYHLRGCIYETGKGGKKTEHFFLGLILKGETSTLTTVTGTIRIIIRCYFTSREFT
jgi:hypothetical protein